MAIYGYPYVLRSVPEVSGEPPPMTEDSFSWASALAFCRVAAVFWGAWEDEVCPVCSRKRCRRSAPLAAEMAFTGMGLLWTRDTRVMEVIGRNRESFRVIRENLEREVRL